MTRLCCRANGMALAKGHNRCNYKVCATISWPTRIQLASRALGEDKHEEDAHAEGGVHAGRADEGREGRRDGWLCALGRVAKAIAFHWLSACTKQAWMYEALPL